jgi:hypothetical protein
VPKYLNLRTTRKSKIKLLFKPYNNYNKPCVKVAYLSENRKALFKKKVAYNVSIFGLLISPKNA